MRKIKTILNKFDMRYLQKYLEIEAKVYSVLKSDEIYPMFHELKQLDLAFFEILVDRNIYVPIELRRQPY